MSFIAKFKDRNVRKNYYDLMRLDRPIGTYLLFVPCLWGIVSAYKGELSYDLIFYSLLFLLGSFLMRSAGCIINDYLDRDLDISVERTKNRPLASGRVKPKHALLLLFILLILSSQLLWFLSPIAITISVLSLAFVCSYPLMKRVINWPQIFLGITYNIGILVAYSTVDNSISPYIFLLYLSGVFHTIAYDTIYAFQDIEDDMKIGIKSSAIQLIDNPKLGVGFIYTVCLLLFGLYLYISYASDISFIFFAFTSFFISYNLLKWDINCPNSSLRNFKISNIYNILFLLSLLVA